MTAGTTLHREARAGVITITLDGPETKNAIGPDVNPAIVEALLDAAAATDVRAAILYGANGYFSSGGNIAALRRTLAMTPAERTQVTDGLGRMVETVRNVPMPVIAAVDGGAAGIGFSLALACDLIVAARDARFVAAQVRLGLTPDGGITRFLAQAMPHQLVTEICMLGKPITAERLAAFGVVNRLVDTGDVLPVAFEIAQALTAGPGRAIARIKSLMSGAHEGTLSTCLAREGTAINNARGDVEAQEGIQAFLEKRPPRFGAL